MTEQESFFHLIGSEVASAEKSQMFGKPCYKVNKKAFICFFKDAMVFKLTAPEHAEALSLKDSELFDPSGKKRPMKEWVQVPFMFKDKWKSFAMAASDYIKSK